MPDISAVLVVLKKPIEAAWETATGNVKERVAKLRATSAIKKLYQTLNATQKVKTIWNVDRAIALNSFYYPTRVRTSGDEIKTISKLDDIDSNAVVLSGIVGQGKSILLRYLLGKEIRSGTRVPVLFELRRIQQSSLTDQLVTTFSEQLGIKPDPELFKHFARQGSVSLLLDGFDEIDPSRISEITTEIEQLASRYPKAKIVITSRPDSAIEHSPHFAVVDIAQLTESDFPSFFSRILKKDKDLADRITEAVLKSPAHVKVLAGTPLLATLLTIVYRASQKIPSDFSEFYDELFQILLVRHDRSKAGYQRKRATQLTDREIQQVFEAYCFSTKREGISSIRRTKAEEIAAQAIATLNLSCGEDKFLDDIIKVTCLLQEEGTDVEFLHQSVQEFFAARYIATRPDDVAAKFYKQILDRRLWMVWDQVLTFLSQIDRYRASQYFFIPVIERTLQWLGALDCDIDLETVKKQLADAAGVKQRFIRDADDKEIVKYFTATPRDKEHFQLPAIFSRLYEVFFTEGHASNWRDCFDKETPDQFVSYRQIAIECGIEEQLNESLYDSVSKLQERLSNHRKQVELMNASNSFVDL